MKNYTIEQVNIGETKSGNKNGRPWEGTKVGLKIAGNWYNAMIFDPQWVAELRNFQTGGQLKLVLYKDSYIKKETGVTVDVDAFRLPGKLDEVNGRIDELAARLKVLEEKLKPELAKKASGPPDGPVIYENEPF